MFQGRSYSLRPFLRAFGTAAGLSSKRGQQAWTRWADNVADSMGSIDRRGEIVLLRTVARPSGSQKSLKVHQSQPKLLSECNTRGQPFLESLERLKSQQMLVFFASRIGWRDPDCDHVKECSVQPVIALSLGGVGTGLVFEI
jgi:hypothetical protein